MESKGKRSVNSLKGAERKSFHKGQFYTPAALAKQIHEWLDLANSPRLSILDNSAGTGRLIDGLAMHRRAAIELDKEAATALQSLATSDPHFEVVCGDFFNVQARQFSLAIINPPFNLIADSRHGRSLGIGLTGQYGEGTRFNTTYAGIAHALQAAGVVIAILPRGALSDERSQCPYHAAFLAAYGHRLRAVFPLPAKTFQEEGTLVSTELAVFLPGTHEAERCLDVFSAEAHQQIRNEARGALPNLSSLKGVLHVIGLPRRFAGLPKTGNGVLRVTRKGRRLVLQPDSIETYSRALDCLTGPLLAVDEAHAWDYARRPRPFALDLQAYLAQPDPQRALNSAIESLSQSKLHVTVDDGLLNWFAREVRRGKIESAPFRRWARVSGHRQRVIFFQSKLNIDVTNIDFEGLDSGARYQLVRTGKHDLFSIYSNGAPTGRMVTNLQAELHMDAAGLAEDNDIVEWRLIYPGVETIAPHVSNNWGARARSLGINQRVYSFSSQDLIEMAARRGGIYHAGMAMGKTRFGISLAQMIGAKHSLVVTRAKDIRTWRDEYRELGSPLGEINEITSAKQAIELTRLNIISVDLLRQRAVSRQSHNTYADLLSGRNSVVISDEAHYFSNSTSGRSRAAALLKPKRFYQLTGSAIKGRTRHVYNLCRLSGGDHTSRQPYGDSRRPKMTPTLLHSIYDATPAPRAFYDDFIRADSISGDALATLGRGRITNEDLRVSNPVLFREYLAPMVLRRRHDEPEVKACVFVPDPVIEVRRVKPCTSQLAVYATQLGSYMTWLRDFMAAHPIPNIEVVKHKLSGLYWAASYPQHFGAVFPMALTTAQRAIVADTRDYLRNNGGKLVIVAQSPEYATFLAEQLSNECPDLTLVTSDLPARARSDMLLDTFHDGASRVLITTYGVIAESYNLPRVDTMFLAGSHWEPHVFMQTIRRMCRPQQTRKPLARVFLTRGTLQEYQHDFCTRKQSAIDESVDFEEGATEDPVSLWGVINALQADFLQSRAIAV